MSNIHLHPPRTSRGWGRDPARPGLRPPRADRPRVRSARAARYVGAGLRIALGWVFLWAFLDKLFGLGFATERGSSWLNGGSPTEGFLNFATKGPFADAFGALAGYAVVDWLFMVGLAGIGLALITGVGVRVAAVSGAVMMVLMWAAALWPENNPFMDDHLVYAGLLVMLALTDAGRTLGLGGLWAKVPFVQRHGWLKRRPARPTAPVLAHRGLRMPAGTDGHDRAFTNVFAAIGTCVLGGPSAASSTGS